MQLWAPSVPVFMVKIQFLQPGDVDRTLGEVTVTSYLAGPLSFPHKSCQVQSPPQSSEYHVGFDQTQQYFLITMQSDSLTWLQKAESNRRNATMKRNKASSKLC